MINWKLRLQNKATLVSLITLVVSIVYQFFSMMGVIPDIEKQGVIDLLCEVIDLLALIGIVVDPTTDGIKDSKRAMTYDEPSRDLIDEINEE